MSEIILLFSFQAYREVFEYLVADFRTYRPLLSAIKNEYELFIEHQEETIRGLLPIKVSSCWV